MRVTLWSAASGFPLTLLTQGRDQLHLSCPMENVVGALDVP